MAHLILAARAEASYRSLALEQAAAALRIGSGGDLMAFTLALQTLT